MKKTAFLLLAALLLLSGCGETRSYIISNVSSSKTGSSNHSSKSSSYDRDKVSSNVSKTDSVSSSEKNTSSRKPSVSSKEDKEDKETKERKEQLAAKEKEYEILKAEYELFEKTNTTRLEKLSEELAVMIDAYEETADKIDQGMETLNGLPAYTAPVIKEKLETELSKLTEELIVLNAEISLKQKEVTDLREMMDKRKQEFLEKETALKIEIIKLS